MPAPWSARGNGRGSANPQAPRQRRRPPGICMWPGALPEMACQNKASLARHGHPVPWPQRVSGVQTRLPAGRREHRAGLAEPASAPEPQPPPRPRRFRAHPRQAVEQKPGRCTCGMSGIRAVPLGARRDRRVARLSRRPALPPHGTTGPPLPPSPRYHPCPCACGPLNPSRTCLLCSRGMPWRSPCPMRDHAQGRAVGAAPIIAQARPPVHAAERFRPPERVERLARATAQDVCKLWRRARPHKRDLPGLDGGVELVRAGAHGAGRPRVPDGLLEWRGDVITLRLGWA